MGKTSRESVEERDLSDQSFSCSGGPKLPSVQTSTSYLHHCACCTPPLPYPITAGKKSGSCDLVDSISDACSIICARNAVSSKTEWWGRIPSHILLGTLPQAAQDAAGYGAPCSVVIWCLQDPQASFWLMCPLCAQTNVWGYSSWGAGLCISLCITLFLKRKKPLEIKCLTCVFNLL